MCRIMRPFQKKFVTVLFLAILLVAAFWAFHPSLLGLLADHYYAQLNQADDAEVEGLVDRLVSLGPPAIPRLTAALGSERKVVAQAVRAQLLEMVKSWEHPDTRPTPAARLALADSLALRMEQYGTSASLHAATLARRMLQASSRGLSQQESGRLLLACESILDAAKSIDGLANQESQNGLAAEETVDKFGTAGNTVLLSERSLADLARLPGGNLPPPLPELEGQRLAPEEGGGIAATPVDQLRKSHGLRSFTTGNSSPNRFSPEEASPRQKPLHEAFVADTGSGLRRLPENPAVRPIELPKGGSDVKPSPRYGSPSPSEKPGQRVYSLIVQLHSDNQVLAEKARRELSIGGFKTVHFALAERLMDPDPEVRKELIRVLPRLQSVRAESWLKWLLQDDSPDVRYIALTTLASSSDPNLVAEVAQAAQFDADPKIRLEGERIERRLTR